MAIYSERYNYVFFANPQTASKAVALTLCEKLSGRRLPEKEVTRNGRVVARQHHTTYSQMLDAGLLTESQLEGAFKFTCVRNPFDQMVSKYIKHCSRLDNDPTKYKWLNEEEKAQRAGVDPVPHSFGQWLTHLFRRYDEVDKMKNGPLEFLNHADYVMRFENLQDGFEEFQRRIGLGQFVPVTEHNVTEGRAQTPKQKKKYVDFYDDNSIGLVQRTYAQILERFNYKFGD